MFSFSISSRRSGVNSSPLNKPSLIKTASETGKAYSPSTKILKRSLRFFLGCNFCNFHYRLSSRVLLYQKRKPDNGFPIFLLIFSFATKRIFRNFIYIWILDFVMLYFIHHDICFRMKVFIFFLCSGVNLFSTSSFCYERMCG